MYRYALQQREWYKNAFESLRQKYGGKCNCCSSKEQLEFAHLQETKLSGWGASRGKKKRYYDIKNNPSCYTLLCRSCHLKLDNGEIILSPVEIPETFLVGVVA